MLSFSIEVDGLPGKFEGLVEERFGAVTVVLRFCFDH